jgi:hypothetical protein
MTGKRRKLMGAWAKYCCQPTKIKTENVVAMVRP